jgi:hypothetical protein
MNDIRINTGASSYFSKPSNALDYHLFEDNEHIYPYVRKTILDLLLDYLGSKYNNPELWTMVWLAGSGVSYQWYADRGNGDLDVLFGVDYSEFVTRNPEFQWSDRTEIASVLTEDLRKNLWPMTSHFPLGGDAEWTSQLYDITFYLNDRVEITPGSITNIHPYAAYNLTKDEWTVKPPKLPDNPGQLYPNEYYEQAEANKETASALAARYNSLNAEGSMNIPGSAQDVNNSKHKALVRGEARNLFDSLHLGRKNAFSDQGEGYGDFYNFQWQHAKQHGVVNALNEIINQEN